MFWVHMPKNSQHQQQRPYIFKQNAIKQIYSEVHEISASEVLRFDRNSSVNKSTTLS